MFVLSFDVAIKSLAVSLIKYNIFEKSEKSEKLDIFEKSEKLDIFEKSEKLDIFEKSEISEKLDIFEKSEISEKNMTILHLNLIDLIPNQKVKDTNIIYRTSMLHKHLNILDAVINNFINLQESKFFVLIEYQMAPNDKTRNVSSQILYHYHDFLQKHKIYNDNIYLVGPSLKNSISITDDGNYSNFIEMYNSNYTANKAHSKYNLKKLFELLKCSDLLIQFNKKNLDDIADAVLMSFAWVCKYHNFILN